MRDIKLQNFPLSGYIIARAYGTLFLCIMYPFMVSMPIILFQIPFQVVSVKYMTCVI